MKTKEKPQCRSYVSFAEIRHQCGKRTGHKGEHYCQACEHQWVSKKRKTRP